MTSAGRSPKGDALRKRSLKAGRFALTTVAVAAVCLMGSSSWALGLGRLTVRSALGEPLRADIEVTSLTNEEAASLALKLASPDAYRAAGIEYNAALAGARVTLDRGANGRAVLRLASDRPLVEPFVDVIVEANWASGRLVREYTLLLDPPTRVATAPTPTMPPVASPAPVPAPTAAPSPPPPAVAVAAPPSSPATPARRLAPPPTAAPAPTPRVSEQQGEYLVRRGDTLSGIASRKLPAGVSLDQMLVSLYRNNPNAFVASNMNRLRAGSVLTLPGAEAAQQVSTAEAREIIRTQSADFDAYRQRLAGGARTQADEGSARQATGTVQARVDDRRQPAAAGPDKLTLSQGAVQASAPEAAISREAEGKASATRVAELSRNVEELRKLQQGTAAAPGAPAAPSPATAAAPQASAAAPALPAAPVAAPAGPGDSAASAPEAAPVVAAAPSAPAPASAPAAAPTPAPTGEDEPGFVENLLDSPWMLPAAGGLIALLIGLGLYRARSRKHGSGETSFLESRLQPDSFFGASGGQRVDTHEAAAPSSSSATSSSMSYSLSQLDAIGDVDPVAEADVYLAYGRDLQAEEILKEAMRANPQRMAIRTKLLEVYAKRRDTKGFELLATQLHALTNGEGEDWAKAQEMGLQIDPENALYQPGGRPEPVQGAGGESVVEPLSATTQPYAATPSVPEFTADLGLDSQPGGLDLDLDLGGDEASTAAETTRPMPTQPDIALEPGLELESAAAFDDVSTEPAAMMPSMPTPAEGDIDFDLDQLGVEPVSPPTMPLPRAEVNDQALDFADFHIGGAGDAGTAPMLPTEMQDGGAAETGVDVTIDEGGDPLARKLELAEEFRQIGDIEGARDLLEEVIAKADGLVKSKAQAMLEGLA